MKELFPKSKEQNDADLGSLVPEGESDDLEYVEGFNFDRRGNFIFEHTELGLLKNVMIPRNSLILT